MRRLLPSELATQYGRCLQEASRPPEALRSEVEDYLATLRRRAATDAFLDLTTAEQVARGCHELLERLGEAGDEEDHGAVQAAVAYFVLEDDAEEDGSVIGFDDDLQVVEATFRALGWDADCTAG